MSFTDLLDSYLNARDEMRVRMRYEDRLDSGEGYHSAQELLEMSSEYKEYIIARDLLNAEVEKIREDIQQIADSADSERESRRWEGYMQDKN